MSRFIITGMISAIISLSAPAMAQDSDSDYIYSRAAQLNGRINMALSDRQISRRQANRLMLSVQRVQQSADRVRDSGGDIDSADADRLNQRLTDIERALPPQQ